MQLNHYCPVSFALLIVAMFALAARAEPPATTQASGELPYSGRVLDPEGTPVADAAVTVSRFDGRRHAVVNVIRTASDGTFSFSLPANPELLGSTIVQLVIEAPEQAIYGGSLVSGVQLDLRLPRRATAQVTVLKPDGQPAAGIALMPRHTGLPRIINGQGWHASIPKERQPALARITDERGIATFDYLAADSRTALSLSDPAYAQLTYEQQLQITREGQPIPLTIRLQPAARISGRITFGPTGAPASGVLLHAQGSEQTRGWAEAISDDEGRYELGQLLAGTHNVLVMLDSEMGKDWTAAALVDINLNPGQHLHDQNLTLIEGVKITGRVVGEDGVPLSPLIGIYGPARPRSGAVQTVTPDADGRFEARVPPGLQHVYVASEPPPPYQRPLQAPPDVVIDAEHNEPIIFKIPRGEGSSLTGRVVDADGKPVGGALVVVESPQNQVSPFLTGPRAHTDADGRFTFPAIPPGSILRAQKERMGTIKAHPLRPGEADVTLTISPQASRAVTAEVVDDKGEPIPHAKVTHFVMIGRFGTGDETIANADGTASFDIWTDRENSIAATAPGWSQERIELRQDPQAAVRLQLIKADAILEGYVEDAAGEGVADLRVQINGRRTALQRGKTDFDGYFRFENVVANDRINVYVSKGEHIAAHGTGTPGKTLYLTYKPPPRPADGAGAIGD